MRLLVTGVSGYVGAALVPRLRAAGHEVRGFARSRERVAAAGVELDDLVLGDAISGAGLGRALDGADAAYYLIHSMEGPANTGFPDQERRAAERFATAARAAGVRRVVYLGGLVPQEEGVASRHLASRLAVERALLEAADEPIALRASIVIGARSRSFRFLVRLIERLPVLALPAWRTNRTQPIDGRDVLEFLVRAADAPAALAGRSYDIAGPGRHELPGADRADRRAHAGRAPRDRARLLAHAGGVGGRRGRRGGGPGLHHAADGIARARPAPARP